MMSDEVPALSRAAATAGSAVAASSRPDSDTDWPFRIEPGSNMEWWRAAARMTPNRVGRGLESSLRPRVERDDHAETAVIRRLRRTISACLSGPFRQVDEVLM